MPNLNLAVNGTLMRGLELNSNLLAVGATFVREATTKTIYRLWSIDDRYPAMLRVASRGGAYAKPGAAIEVEIWAVPEESLSTILLQEPAGLCIGKVGLSDGEVVLGVLAEPFLCENRREITQWGGWRAYIEALSAQRAASTLIET